MKDHRNTVHLYLLCEHAATILPAAVVHTRPLDRFELRSIGYGDVNQRSAHDSDEIMHGFRDHLRLSRIVKCYRES